MANKPNNTLHYQLARSFSPYLSVCSTRWKIVIYICREVERERAFMYKWMRTLLDFFAECVVQSIKMGGKRSSYLSISKFLYIRTTFFMMKPAFLSIYYLFSSFSRKGKKRKQKETSQTEILLYFYFFLHSIYIYYFAYVPHFLSWFFCRNMCVVSRRFSKDKKL